MSLLGTEKTLNIIDFKDLEPWMADHGFEMKMCRYAQIRLPASPGPHGIPLWLDVEYYKLNEKGERFLDWETKEAALAVASVPLKSWPPLTPVAEEKYERTRSDAEILAAES